MSLRRIGDSPSMKSLPSRPRSNRVFACRARPFNAAVTPELFPNSQHLNANVQVTVTGDSATGRVMCFNPMEMALSEGEKQVFMLGLWYHDEYTRTPAGWRFTRREEEKSWVFNTPDFMQM